VVNLENSAFADLKVVDFSQVLTGPIMAKHLADFGATVVKVESSRKPDTIRTSQPYKDGNPGIDRSGYFAFFNPNKYSIALDLSHSKGPSIGMKLIMWADVVIESFRPGIMERWGLSYEDIKKVKPEIVMLRTSNQGQTGPRSRQPGLGSHLNGLTGLISSTGWPDREPANLLVAYTDYVTPFLGVSALIAALDYKRKTGKGQMLDMAQFEAGLQFFSPALLDFLANGRDLSRRGNSSPSAAPHGVYPCREDDSWCAIGVLNDKEWQAFARVIDSPAWTNDEKFATLISRKKNEDELNALVAAFTVNFSAREIMEKMQTAGIAAGAVQGPREVCEDAQLNDRGFFWEMEHPELGAFHHLGQPAILSETPARPRRPAPCLGEHTEMVCREFLGMSEAEYDALLVDRVFE
jgi:benzylsuccinate CoA-transferase BbsF subunit